MTTNIELDAMRADQCAANCPCGETAILSMGDTGVLMGKVSVEYVGECPSCGRLMQLAVTARRLKVVVDLERRDRVLVVPLEPTS